MMRAISSLTGSALSAKDGTIGMIKDSYFDDHAWAIRYLVVETGGWLSSRKVLISPHSVTPPLGDKGMINIALTREKIRGSPDIDTHQPVSRRQEGDFLSYYGIPFYWASAGLSSMGAYAGAYTMIPPPSPLPVESEYARREAVVKREDVHLRSAGKLSGYHLQASDESIGHIEDFIFDDESWAIRYLVVDTRNWWPAGKRVLVATRWIESISWAEQKVFTSLNRESVKAGPVYDDATVIDRDYETRLHHAQCRKGYWEAITSESRI
jgi:uncharacterized protein YrrD